MELWSPTKCLFLSLLYRCIMDWQGETSTGFTPTGKRSANEKNLHINVLEVKAGQGHQRGYGFHE